VMTIPSSRTAAGGGSGAWLAAYCKEVPLNVV
jgi:hypothetical protein